MDHGPNSELAPQLAAWRDAVGELAFASAFATPDGGCDLVRSLASLVQTHPQLSLAIDEPLVAALLDVSADASAALALVEPLAGYMLSRAPGGRHLATVVLVDQASEHHAEGASAALALVGALATALAEPVGNTTPKLRPNPNRELRLN
ncbi:MAG: hypothetical protein JSR28_13605 [Proteobacteria bacterium]|nr:hypothetical protein [Pseudomonadota bacterium]